MALASLDNSVIFKKLFTDPEILTVFFKDLTGIELEPETIETEKRFSPAIGPVDVEFDIFVEDPKHRLIVEIQKVRYDYHYDRFLHYHQVATVELVKSHSDYKLERAVHTIVWLTRPVRDKTHQHSLITTSLCSIAEDGQTISLYPHKLYFLNPNYVSDRTPSGLADWLQLVVESIKNREQPNLNSTRTIFQKAAELIKADELTPQERAVYFNESEYESKRQADKDEGLQEGLKKGLQQGRQEGIRDTARAMLAEGLEPAFVAKVTGLPMREVAALLAAG
jgi:predicted transposase/invertase (TIGR01784 family)